MSELDEYGASILVDYEAGELESVASKEEIERLREAARSTDAKDQ